MENDISASDPAERAYRRLLQLAETDTELRRLVPLPSVTEAMRKPDLSAREIIGIALDGYAERAALGERAYDIATNAETGQASRHYREEFETISYSELRRRVEALANAWQTDARHKIEEDEFVCIFGSTSTDYAVVDLACYYAQTVSVPLQANASRDELDEVFADVDPAALIASVDNLDLVVGLAAGLGSVRSVIVMDIDLRDDEERLRFDAARRALAAGNPSAALTTLDALIVSGSASQWKPRPRHALGVQRMAALIYTSGSTGTPKGAIITEFIQMQHWTTILRPQPTIAVSFAPLNHLLGRKALFNALAQGGTVYFTLKSDMSTLLDDYRIVRPTNIVFIPRLAELIYQHYQAEVNRRILAGEADAEAAARQVRNDMRHSFLGDRLISGTIGGAPTSPEVLDFLRDCFDIFLGEGYATTESGGTVTFNHRIFRTVVTDYKLRDVPELGYHLSDKPYPRGELLFKAETLIPGYFNRPEASAALLDEEGYQITGDIFEERGPDHLVWIDRKNNVLKLSQGEYVAISRLEAIFEGNAPIIDQIYIYGSSFRSYLLAIVVPNVELATAQLGRDPTVLDLKHLALAAMRETARLEKLKNFELPRDVIIELEPFSLENGLLSSVRKPLRPNLKRKYGDRLEALYEDMERKQRDDLAALSVNGSDAPVLDRLIAVVEGNLGIAGIDPSRQQSFADLGGDSLGAASLSLMIETVFGVAIPVSTLLSPASSLSRVASQIATALSAGAGDSPLLFEQVHGKDPQSIAASDLTLAAFLGPLPDIAAMPPPAVSKTVLLTGSTGFLGRFLCLAWLDHLAMIGGKLICLIRAPDAVNAMQRFDGAFDELEPDMAAHFKHLAARHVEIIVGDIGEPQLGLSADDHDRLAEAVDHIVHPAALVNHALSYADLFEPNVAGTAELIRLALKKKMKRFDYVSTVAVLDLCNGIYPVSEDSDIREAAPEIELKDSYAAGYAVSKWASEILLRDAHENYGLPVNVYRTSMILAHSTRQGQINASDMFSRLLFSVIATGLAPETFYERALDGGKGDAHYDGLPVDFVADAMTGIGTRPNGGFNSYNIVNLHDDDGVSLDRIVDWVETAGYAIQRIAEYGSWFEKFETRLRNLPRDQRQSSSLPILEAFARAQKVHRRTIASEQFSRALNGKEVPHISERFIHKNLSDLQRLGVLWPASPEPLARSHKISA